VETCVVVFPVDAACASNNVGSTKTMAMSFISSYPEDSQDVVMGQV
jgi:hypothetical protein